MDDQPSIQSTLKQCLGPEWLSYRTGHGGLKVAYIEGKTAINLANEIFGYNGWSSEVKDSTVDFADSSNDGRFNVGIATTVRITLKDGTFHEDVGYGFAENSRSRAGAYEKARKQSTTDGMKRAIRMFGNAVGNCLLDQSYLRNVGTMARPQIPFIPLELYRHPSTRKKILEEQMKSTSKNQPSVTASSTVSNPTHPPSNKTPVIPPLKQQPVAKNTTPPQQPAPPPITSCTPKNNVAIDQIKTIKRQFEDDDFGPEIFSEDSFMIDDDDEFYAQVADYDVMVLSPPPAHSNNDSSTDNDQSAKRQRQQ